MAKGLLVVLGVALILVASAAAYRTWRQHDAAKALAIRAPNGIDEARFVKINGVEQWISIRGEDRSNPVLVLLHGGPGVAFLPVGYKALRSWEKDFTVVQWDQPGAGRTFGKHGPEGSGDLTLDRIAADGIAVVEQARRKLGKDKVVLVGVSWGSVVGVEMSRRRPDLFHTYVGAGQVVDMQRNEAVGFDALLQKIRANGDTKAETKLLTIGAPPYAGRKELLAERKILEANPPESERGLYRSLIPVLLSAPDYGLKDIRAWLDAGKFSIGQMLPALMTYSDDVPAPAIPVPVVFLQGVEDIQTPTVLVKSYFERLQAPSKRLVLIPGGGHSAVIAMPDTFLKALNTHVRPMAVEAEAR